LSVRYVHYYPLARYDSGVSIALWAWARALAAAGEEVVVLHAGAWGPTPPQPGFAHIGGTGIADVEVPHRARRHRLTLHPVDLGRHLGRGDVLVLHEGWVPSNLVAAKAARRRGVPYLVMPHGVYDPQWMRYLHPPMSLRTRLERRLLEGALAVHLFHESEIPEVRAVAPGARFLVVPTGYDLPPQRWTGGGGYLSWIGRVDITHKGLDLVAAAIASLPQAERPRLLVHGYDYKGGITRLRRLVADLDLDDCVRIEGVVAGEEKQAFLQRAEGYVHPSRWECHSTALLENLALGVPCLVSSSIHIAAQLACDGAALLTPPTTELMGRKLVELVERREHLAFCGRSFVSGHYAWDHIVPAYFGALRRFGLG